MFKKILIPLDGSERAERALGYATALSIPTAASLVLVRTAVAHVVPGTDAREAQARVIDEAEKYLVDVAAQLIGRGFRVEAATPYSESPAAWIIEEVGLRQADLIAMTTHGRTGPGRWLFGSVAEHVVAASPVPVLMDRGWLPQRRELWFANSPRILVTLDGSEFAEAALGVAAGLADDVGGELILLHVREHPEAAFPSDYASLSEIHRERKDAAGQRTAIVDYLAGAADRVARAWPDINIRVEERPGDPADEVVAATEALDVAVVVMGTHGRTGLARAVMGSVSGVVLQHGSTPLVLVHPGSLEERFRLPAASAAQESAPRSIPRSG
jgi:nucleotide-binding universal stress UspA family protein